MLWRRLQTAYQYELKELHSSLDIQDVYLSRGLDYLDARGAASSC